MFMRKRPPLHSYLYLTACRTADLIHEKRMKALIFILILSINVLQPKKYLIEVADENKKVENPACKCGVEREGRRTRIVGGTEVNLVRSRLCLKKVKDQRPFEMVHF